jgi:chemotaxis protein CheD
VRSHQTDLPVINLHPGELFVAQEPTLVTTILGSCVSVCLFCPQRKIGAMCHGVMPSRDEKYDLESFRFVDSSVTYMVDVLTNGMKGGHGATLVAKLFGGAEVLNMQGRPDARSIGAQNIAAARKALAHHGINLTAERVGGREGYRLYFYTHTGEVFVRSVKRSGGVKGANEK